MRIHHFSIWHVGSPTPKNKKTYNVGNNWNNESFCVCASEQVKKPAPPWTLEAALLNILCWSVLTSKPSSKETTTTGDVDCVLCAETPLMYFIRPW